MTPLPIKTAAEQAGVNRRTLQRWIQEGCLRKLPDGKVDLDEVRRQVDYLLTARRRGPAPGQRKQRRDPYSDEEFRRHIAAEAKRYDKAIRLIDQIDDPDLVSFIIDHAVAKLPPDIRNQARESGASPPKTNLDSLLPSGGLSRRTPPYPAAC